MLPDRICDPHHHLWELPTSHYPPSEHTADLARVPQVVSTVFVECEAWYRTGGPGHLRAVGETEFVARHGDPRIRGIIGCTDLRLGARTEEALDAHIVAGDGRFRGIRHRATWDASPLIRSGTPDPGPGLLVDPDFQRGARSLARRGLSFDAWLYFPQLPDVSALARAVPDLVIVLDHLGGPIVLGPYTDRDVVLAETRRLLAPLIGLPNVVVKVGGIGMPMYGLGWHKRTEAPAAHVVAGAWRDIVHWTIDSFGPERCMLESNFPVDRFSVDYPTLWDAFDILTSHLDDDERALLFHDTAVRVYRIS